MLFQTPLNRVRLIWRSAQPPSPSTPSEVIRLLRATPGHKCRIAVNNRSGIVSLFIGASRVRVHERRVNANESQGTEHGVFSQYSKGRNGMKTS